MQAFAVSIGRLAFFRDHTIRIHRVDHRLRRPWVVIDGRGSGVNRCDGIPRNPHEIHECVCGSESFACGREAQKTPVFAAIVEVAFVGSGLVGAGLGPR